jgi:hypothetical protein
VTATESGETTLIRATVPTSSGVQISWRLPTEREPSFSRAVYRGVLEGGAISWRGEFRVDLFEDETVTLPLLPRTVTLTNLQVDGQDAPILMEGKKFAALIRGRGSHDLVVLFRTPVAQNGGPPKVDLQIPTVPVSRFELSLPGRKELTATPAGSVTTIARQGRTEATVHVPLTSTLSLSWSEAVPEAAQRELRVNANLYHAIHAEEGVLYARARVQIEVRRGETNRIELLVPNGVQINRVEADSGAVADWRVAESAGNRRVLQVFLDRQLKEELLLDVFYDRSLGASGAAGDVESIPLLTATGVGRQRGMVALLSTRDLALNPEDGTTMTRVGENQLPSFVRDVIELTVAHTFKYTDAPGDLNVTTAEPERVAARFDARVDTLVSLGEVTLSGSATVELNVKSGGLEELALILPAGTSLLDLSAPSLRTHRASDDEQPRVELEFTQALEGQFRVELSYERILADDESEIAADTLRVEGADVEQGRIAVEALSAVEILPTITDELTPIEIGELPRQLVLRTTNPILAAFKYARAEPPPRLALTVTRHRLVDVQEAAIDTAEYRTLFTRDGLSVTTARFIVRNARKQFLRVELPQDSEVWSVFVAGRQEKPALSTAEEADPRSILIKIVNATDGFPVDVIFATRRSAIGSLGTVHAELPRPDILVTQSRWDVFLPEGMSYGTPRSNMNTVDVARPVSREEIASELGRLQDSGVSPNVIEPLRISVPATGVRYGFEKLYANQANVDAFVSISFASAGGAVFGQAMSLVGVLLLWGSLALFWFPMISMTRRAQLATAGLGAMLVLVAVGVYHVRALPALLLSMVFLLAGAYVHGRPYLERFRRAASASETEAEAGAGAGAGTAEQS